ncbi:MAG: bifunctional diguanylate cyclase/phosphodiesterase [Gammaproteobacteria bacterium]|nr:bifunctional diguanylate cyclase/phosphodiesterase [Gammaproteobacteria bacterium]
MSLRDITAGQQIGRNIHGITVEMQGRTDEIRRIDMNLEQRIAARTAELLEANAALLEANAALHEANTALRKANAALRESDERYRMLYHSLVVPILIVDPQGRLLDINARACRYYGYDRGFFLTLQLSDIDESAQTEEAPARLALLQQGSCAFETLHRAANGRLRHVEVKTTPIMLDGRPAVLLLCHDISHRKQAEQELMHIRANLERAQTMARIGNWTLDFTTNRVEWSQETYRIFGIKPGTLITQDLFFSHIHPADFDQIERGWELALAGHPHSESTFRIIVDGQVKWLRNIIENRFDEHGRLVSMFGTQQDITEQKINQERIEYLAFYDELTGLPNRHLGQDLLTQAVARAEQAGERLAVLFVDLDQFKHVNEMYGHQTGDQLLKAVSARLSRDIQDASVLSRSSADELMLVLSQLPLAHPLAHIERTCERILASIAESFDIDGEQVFVTASIGVAIYPQDGGDEETLRRHADAALSAAKKAGPHAYRFFDPGMNESLKKFVQIRNELRSALLHGELQLSYQPQVDLNSGKITGIEALIRWDKPGEGLRSPETFIQIAEESRLIIPIGRWILREACQRAATCQAMGSQRVVMAVNISAAQILHADFEQDVLKALTDSGLAPNSLELELTESMLLKNQQSLIETLTRLKALGIQLSIDDFGTGYSSLAYLKRFKVDKLKIDRSFVSGLQNNEEDSAIVQAIIQIARSLSLRTIAEGVECQEIANRLKFMGCDEAQGYLYAKPMQAIELEQWLKKHRKERKPGADQ